jgi:hypothetical protein
MDYTKMRPIKPEPKMQDPHRFPKVQAPLEQQSLDLYSLELNKMLVDITKKLKEFNSR